MERSRISRYLNTLLNRLEGTAAGENPAQQSDTQVEDEDDPMGARRRAVRMMFR